MLPRQLQACINYNKQKCISHFESLQDHTGVISRSRLNRGSNSQPSGHESDMFTTEPPGRGRFKVRTAQGLQVITMQNELYTRTGYFILHLLSAAQWPFAAGADKLFNNLTNFYFFNFLFVLFKSVIDKSNNWRITTTILAHCMEYYALAP